ncbi:hypothetical protein VCHA27O13_20206 [Vibrio chagasii]|nr:hypothetical protein VCHA27O13_20206 [Vibrio chagasii]CAH7132983.1 hypothetical protein VCHA39O224_100009 [Vibrio chagasii]CAH7159243.1 hypothetical protein VCHA37P191_240010 [Vibrio chagasii]CAH7289093.1 hypothetical protein VCHA41O249_50148 [Vibrio chagasii]CAH7321389.1 hypothetical protein VCHA37P193_50128 [Vibrio chagasii]
MCQQIASTQALNFSFFIVIYYKKGIYYSDLNGAKARYRKEIHSP